MAKVYLNGEFVAEEEASVNVFDHGLLYGDGIFEGIRAYEGYVFQLDQHLDRLYRSARIINLDIPHSLEEMKEIILDTLRENQFQDAYIRPLITRGKGSLGLSPTSCESPTVIVICKEWRTLYDEELYRQGLRAITSSVRNQPVDGLPPTVKSLNYLTNVLASLQATRWDADEAIMLDGRGYVSEGAADNLFIYRKGEVFSPPVVNNLPGVTRRVLLDILKEKGYSVREEDFGLAELYSAEEVFLSGTAAEVISVVEVDGRQIGEGKPGELSRELRRSFDELTGQEDTGTPIYG